MMQLKGGRKYKYQELCMCRKIVLCHDHMVRQKKFPTARGVMIMIELLNNNMEFNHSKKKLNFGNCHGCCYSAGQYHQTNDPIGVNK